jgi:hypothetical protein
VDGTIDIVLVNHCSYVITCLAGNNSEWEQRRWFSGNTKCLRSAQSDEEGGMHLGYCNIGVDYSRKRSRLDKVRLELKGVTLLR